MHRFGEESQRLCYERFLHDPKWLVDANHPEGRLGMWRSLGSQGANVVSILMTFLAVQKMKAGKQHQKTKLPKGMVSRFRQHNDSAVATAAGNWVAETICA